MKRFRSITMSATLVLLLALAAVCACSAFVQIPEAKAFFNSPPMAVAWCVLLVGMLAGAMMIRTLRRNWPTMLAHLGGAMILAGALFASEAGVNLLNETICEKTPIIRDAMIPLVPTQPNGQLVHVEDDGRMEPAGTLPGFTLRCNLAKQVYYDAEAETPRWALLLAWEDDKRTPVDLANDGTFTPILNTEWECAMIDYLDANAADAMLVMVTPDGHLFRAALSATERVEVGKDSGVFAREVRAFSRFTLLRGPEGKSRMAEAPREQGTWNPASLVELTMPNAKPQKHLVYNPAMALYMAGDKRDGAIMMVLRPKPYEENRLGEPLVQLGFRRKGEDRIFAAWLAPRPGEDSAVRPLAHLYDSQEAYDKAGKPILGITRPDQMVRSYSADVSVLDESGKELHRHEMIVNDPLRYGGYQFSLQSFHAGQFPILRVRSTVGLDAIWLGFGLLLAGVFGGLWIRPLWQTIRRKGAMQ